VEVLIMSNLTHFLRLRGRGAALWIATLLMLTAPAGRAEPIDVTIEYRLKAAYLYNFTKFIEWPPPAFEGPASPFVVGVVDPDGSAATIISETLRGKTTATGRAIEVRRLTALAAGAGGCHQLFITKASGLDPLVVRSTLGAAHVLVVGETDDFAEQGGAIGLVVAGDAVRCEVNLAGAERAGVKLSGRLASVARLVRENVRR
jgi:hypothetical protein